MNEQQQQAPKAWTFQGQELFFHLKTYKDGGLAVQAWAASQEEDGFYDPYATISVNAPGESKHLPEGYFYLKHYAENEPIALALVKEGLIEILNSSYKAQVGYMTVIPYRFTEKGKQYIV